MLFTLIFFLVVLLLLALFIVVVFFHYVTIGSLLRGVSHHSLSSSAPNRFFTLSW